MLKRTMLGMLVVAAFAQGQEAAKTFEPGTFYKLDFVVKEVEGGKVLNSRAYSMMANNQGPSSIRTGTRVPVTFNASTQYIDVGVNIDCRALREAQGELFLGITTEISSVPSDPSQPGAGNTGLTALPAVRQNKWSSPARVPLKKATLIFSSDDPASRRQMQLELTATPIAP
jgi:hypothetical protein